MQISEDLIKHITSELLRRIKNGSNIIETAKLPLLHLVGKTTDLSTSALARLHEQFEVQEHLSWEDPLPIGASSLITKLNIQALVRVAEGDEGCTVEGRVLLTSLLNGQPVAALKDGVIWHNYVKTAPEALLNRYRQCEKILTSYGLKLVSEMEIAEALLPKQAGGLRPKPHFVNNDTSKSTVQAVKPGASKRRVLTESDIMSACPVAGGHGQSLNLNPGDIITPLAHDYAYAMRINIVRNKGVV